MSNMEAANLPEGNPYEDEGLIGENPGTDIRRDYAKFVNNRLKGLSKVKVEIDLGEEHKGIPIDNVRFRDSDQEGSLVAYIKEEVSEHKKIVITVVALSVVAAGLGSLKLRRSKK